MDMCNGPLFPKIVAYAIPLMIRVPGLEGGRCSDAPASLVDLAPTILDLSGTRADRRFAGRSLLPILQGREAQPVAFRVTQSNGNEQYGIQRSIFDEDWKYVFNGFDEDELYDLRNDPGETRNLAREPGYEDVIRRYCEKLWRFARENRDVIINPYIMTAMAPYGPGILFEAPNEPQSIPG